MLVFFLLLFLMVNDYFTGNDIGVKNYMKRTGDVGF